MATTTRSETHLDGRLDIVRDLSSDLIRARIRENRSKERLDRAIRDSVNGGASVDSLSEASGLDPSQVREISEYHRCKEDLSTLLGIT